MGTPLFIIYDDYLCVFNNLKKIYKGVRILHWHKWYQCTIQPIEPFPLSAVIKSQFIVIKIETVGEFL